MRLKGEVALVTGSTKGCGRAIARKFGAEGAAVVVTGRTESAGRDVCDEITGSGGRAIFVRTDVTKESDVVAAVAAAVSEFGKLTVLVNNAATMDMMMGGVDRAPVDGNVRDLTTERWHSVLDMVLTSQFWGCKYAIPAMTAAGGGSIINISSIAGAQAVAGTAAYSTGKAGVQGLTRAVAVEEAPQNIRCNAIIVGAVPHAGLADSSSQVDPLLEGPFGEALRSMQLTRLGRPEDIANLCAFLGSHEADFLTASIYHADGGSIAKMAVPQLELANAEFAKA